MSENSENASQASRDKGDTVKLIVLSLQNQRYSIQNHIKDNRGANSKTFGKPEAANIWNFSLLNDLNDDSFIKVAEDSFSVNQ